MPSSWSSARLIYRAIEKEDEDFLSSMSSDPEALANASPMLWRPQGKKDTEAFRGFLEKQLLCCVVCVPPAADTNPPSTKNDSTQPKPIPIGLVSLQPVEERQIQHRRTELGIHISKSYQGKGYGTEAIYWALDWAFSYAGMHRVEIDAFGANTGAIKLYGRMGFTLEGHRRDYIFIHGKFWDAVIFSMLEDEWKGMREAKLRIDAPGGTP